MKRIVLLSTALLFAVGAHAQTSNYKVTSLVTNSQDPHLVNPWGLSHPPKNNDLRNEWWVTDEVTGYSTLYNANGLILPLNVKIPAAAGSGAGTPTGEANSPVAAIFAFATLDGTISTWNANEWPAKPGARCFQCHVGVSTIVVNNSASGASYQGLTIATNAASGNLVYYVANANGGIETYDASSFVPVTLPPGAFTDTKIPSTYTPAGVQALGSKVFVTYNATSGGGTGYVDAFDTNGKLVMRLQNGWFNQPWGVVASPANFGTFSNMLLVGNTGSGISPKWRRRPVHSGPLGFGVRQRNQAVWTDQRAVFHGRWHASDGRPIRSHFPQRQLTRVDEPPCKFAQGGS